MIFLPKMDAETIKCKNCLHPVSGRYCASCGQAAEVQRFNINTIAISFMQGIAPANGGLISTIKALFSHPGIMLREYLSGRRIIYANPFGYLVIISTLSALLLSNGVWLQHLDENFIASSEARLFTSRHFNLRMVLTIPLYAGLGWMVFRRYGYNFAEHIVINTFVISQAILMVMVDLTLIILFKPEGLLFDILHFGSFVLMILYQILVFILLFPNEHLVFRSIRAIIFVLGGFLLNIMLANFLAKLF